MRDFVLYDHTITIRCVKFGQSGFSGWRSLNGEVLQGILNILLNLHTKVLSIKYVDNTTLVEICTNEGKSRCMKHYMALKTVVIRTNYT